MNKLFERALLKKGELYWRVGLAVFYVLVVLLVCVGASFFEPVAGVALLHTFVNAESAYVWWSGFGFHPLLGYLPVVLTTGTMNAVVVWLVVFFGESPLLLSFVRWLDKRERRAPRLGNSTHRYLGLFALGLFPSLYPLGFIRIKREPIRGGFVTVLAGNAVKLVYFAMLYWAGDRLGYRPQFTIPGALMVAGSTLLFLEWLLDRRAAGASSGWSPEPKA